MDDLPAAELDGLKLKEVSPLLKEPMLSSWSVESSRMNLPRVRQSQRQRVYLPWQRRNPPAATATGTAAVSLIAPGKGPRRKHEPEYPSVRAGAREGAPPLETVEAVPPSHLAPLVDRNRGKKFRTEKHCSGPPRGRRPVIRPGAGADSVGHRSVPRRTSGTNHGVKAQVKLMRS